MRISIQWLAEWLGARPDPRELAAGLTASGLEVEAVEPVAPPLEGVIVGEILERVKHPDADTLLQELTDAVLFSFLTTENQ